MGTPWVIAWILIIFFAGMMIYFRDRAYKAEADKKYWKGRHSKMWRKYKEECKIK